MDMFHLRQRRGRVMYTLALALIALGLSLGVMGVISALNPGDSVMGVEDVPFTLGYTVFFLGMGIFISRTLGRRRKEALALYAQLSDAQRAQVNAELALKPRPILLGADRLYFYWGLFLFFMPYQDIAWVFRTNTAMPLVMEAGGVALKGSHMISGLVIYSRHGRHYTVHAGDTLMSGADLTAIIERAPHAIAGYSRARHRLAKQDFQRFLVEGRHIW